MNASTRPQRPASTRPAPRQASSNAVPELAAPAPQAPPPPTPSVPTPPSQDVAALFRAYRAQPLEQVLEKMGATSTPEGWRLPSGQHVAVSGQPGRQSWRVVETGEANRGAIDLVVHLRGCHTRQALAWLQEHLPGVEPVAAPTPPAGSPDGATPGGAVRGQPAQQGPRWTREQLNEIFERYKSIRLNEVLERLGAHPNQDGDKSKWKIDGLGNIITKGQRWQNVQTEVDKGFGGVDLVAHAMFSEMDRGKARMKALFWMIKEFGEQFGDDLVADDVSDAPKQFSPPDRFADQAPNVIQYLVNERHLPSHLVEELVREGNVYGSHPWSENHQRHLTFVTRCVFLGPASAELRDTTADGFKGCCDGSQTDASGFSVRPVEAVAEGIVAMAEAAIDAISYRALFPGRFVMSTNGAGRFLLQFRVAREAIERGFGVRMALDADTAGDVPSQKIFNAFYVRKALSHHLGVPPEQVDEWLVAGDIVLRVDHSPHHLFFNTGWAEQLPVHASRLVQQDKGAHTTWEPTGATAKPTITLDVRKDLHARLRRGEVSLTVSQAGFDYVVDTLDIRRDRPVNAKDWNEEVKRLGSAFSLAYDELARGGFAAGVPPLPASLEALRRSPDAPAPAEPAARPKAPPAAQAGGGQASSSRPCGPRR